MSLSTLQRSGPHPPLRERPRRLPRVVPLRNDLHRLSHDKGWEEELAGHGKDRGWLQEQADCVLIGWLNEVSAETEDA